jgi:putative ABC transport system permease protein
MMTASLTSNRSMFWRIVRRLLTANLSRLFVILLALGAGAAVTAALLNLQIDAKRRLTTEFRTFGANVIVTPRDAQGNNSGSNTLDEALLSTVPTQPHSSELFGVPFLYVTTKVAEQNSTTSAQAVVAGTILPLLSWVEPGAKTTSQNLSSSPSGEPCYVGENLASKLHIQAGSTAQLTDGDKTEICAVAEILSTGGPADSQIFLDLHAAQRLANLPGRLSMIQLVIGGTPKEIETRVADLAAKLPQADVRPIRQFTEGEASIYNRISGLLTATVAIVLLLTGLCVMAAMTNIAIERKNDVGLMKAVGGSMRRVLRLFLVEAAVLGLAGGIVGAAAGILISIALGKAVFGIAAQPRLIVYPVAVALTVVVAILGAYPLRRLANIRPASVFRGEA